MADGWERTMPLEELEEARPRRIVVGDTDAFVLRNGEALYAIGLRCTHQGRRWTVACCTSPVRCPP